MRRTNSVWDMYLDFIFEKRSTKRFNLFLSLVKLLLVENNTNTSPVELPLTEKCLVSPALIFSVLRNSLPWEETVLMNISEKVLSSLR